MSMPPYDPAHYGAPKPPRKRSNALIFALVFLGVGLLLCLLGSCVAAISGNDKSSPAPSQTFSALPTEQPATTPAAPPAVAASEQAAQELVATPSKADVQSYGGGTWEVGTDIKAGTYLTEGADHCYWARLKDFDGELSSIRANDNLFNGARGRITIKKSDAGVEFRGDCVWTRK